MHINVAQAHLSSRNVSLGHFEGEAVNVVVMCDADYQPMEYNQGTLSRGGWYTHSSACYSEPNSIHGHGWSRQKNWIDSPLSLDENDQIFDTFCHFEEGSISTSTADGRKTLLTMPVSV